MIFDRKKSIFEYPIIAFDTETSGAFPLEAEVIELGAVKWFKGEVVGKFQTLLRPSSELRPDNIRIHGITNEMVADAPKMKTEITKFCDFIDNSVLLAHHAPFDLGFLAVAIEKNNLRFPNNLNLCSSLISRALLTATNHKLQTLIKELKLVGGEAHRAYDDSYACLQVLLKSIEKLRTATLPLENVEGALDSSLERILAIQKKDLHWNKFSIYTSRNDKIIALARAIEGQKSINIIYEGGQAKGKTRPIKPLGIVRNPDGDYIQAECGLDFQRKRFYIEKITEVEII